MLLGLVSLKLYIKWQVLWHRSTFRRTEKRQAIYAWLRFPFDPVSVQTTSLSFIHRVKRPPSQLSPKQRNRIWKPHYCRNLLPLHIKNIKTIKPFLHLTVQIGNHHYVEWVNQSIDHGCPIPIFCWSIVINFLCSGGLWWYDFLFSSPVCPPPFHCMSGFCAVV